MDNTVFSVGFVYIKGSLQEGCLEFIFYTTNDCFMIYFLLCCDQRFFLSRL